MYGFSFTVLVLVNFKSWVNWTEVAIIAPLGCLADACHSPTRSTPLESVRSKPTLLGTVNSSSLRLNAQPNRLDQVLG
jgi:hypothetical protein